MIKGRDFAAPVFRGGRFESKTLVIDVLPDLAAYRDLIVALAKHLVLDREPERKRVPKGFAESFQIGISAVEAGSAIPVLTRIESSPAMPWFDVFDEARDLVEQVVASAGKKESLPKAFPLDLAARFNQFGRGLRENEYIELRGPGALSGPRYDSEIRKAIVLQRESRYEARVDITGWVDGGSITKEVLTIRRENESLLECKQASELVRVLLSKPDQLVRVIGVGVFDRDDRLERMVLVDDVVPADDEEQTPEFLRLAARFEELANLPEDWFEGGAPPLDQEGLRKTHAFLVEAMKQGAPAPYVYPTPDGEARAEWSLASWEVSAVFDLKKGSIWTHAADLDSDADKEEELLLTDPNALNAFVGFLEAISRMGGS